MNGTNGRAEREKAVALTALLKGDTTDVLYTIPIENVDEYNFLVK